MVRIRLVILAGMGLLAAVVLGAEPAPLAEDEQDLVIFHDDRPYLMRLHIQIDQRPLQVSWTQYLAEMFRRLDRDQNGSLDAKEVGLAPSVGQLHQQIAGIVAVEPEPAPEFKELDTNKDGKVSADELSHYYRRQGVGPLQVEYSWRQGDEDALGTTLFARLDVNKDGKLTRDEVTAEALRRFDVDDNELITALEVMPAFPGPGMVTHTPTAESPPPMTVPFAPAHRGDGAGQLGQRVVKRYDADKDGKLSLKEIGLEKALFQKLDGDGDGFLTAAEVNQWPSHAPDMEVVVPLGQNVDKERLVVLPGKRLTLADEDHGGLSLLLSNLRVEMVPRRGTLADLTPGRKEAEKVFESADADKDGALDTKEIYHDPFELVGLSRLADFDGDGKLARAEIKEYLDLQAKLLSCSTYLTLSDRGRALFELIDRDHDGRFNLREAATAWERLKGYDADGDGALTHDELPRQFLVTLSHGQMKFPRENADRLGYGRAFQFGERVRGPVWFRKMDRNRDGDVSRREFAGSAEMFQKLDANGDGFLTLSEAELAESKYRQK